MTIYLGIELVSDGKNGDKKLNSIFLKPIELTM